MTTYYAVRVVDGGIVTVASEFGPIACVFAEESDAVCCRDSWHELAGLDPDEYPLEIEEVEL